MRKAFLIPIALVGLVGAGCTTVTEDGSDWSGSYSGPYNRVDGTASVAVLGNNTVSVTVNDPVAGTYSGNTSLVSGGSYSVQVSNGANTLTVEGFVSPAKDPAERSATMTGSGAFTFSSNLSRRGEADQASWFGQYSGTFTGQNSGTWTANVSQNGSFTMSVVDNDGTYNVSGIITLSGAIGVEGAGAGGNAGISLEMFGAGIVMGGDVSVSGGWSDSQQRTGTWTGSRI